MKIIHTTKGVVLDKHKCFYHKKSQAFLILLNKINESKISGANINL